MSNTRRPRPPHQQRPPQPPRPQAQRHGAVFNLDALTRDCTPGPFSAQLGGREFVFSDPKEWDWQDADTIMSGEQAALAMLGDEQYQAFRAIRMPQWKLDRLMKAVEEHFARGE
jgi:hypothetical protein